MMKKYLHRKLQKQWQRHYKLVHCSIFYDADLSIAVSEQQGPHHHSGQLSHTLPAPIETYAGVQKKD